MIFIFNNWLLFDSDEKTLCIVGQPESLLTLSMPAVRLLKEFIKNRGCVLGKEDLITRVWDDYGFKPSGSNLNRTISELRKSFHTLDENHEYIVTVPRIGFRFEADIIVQNVKSELPEKTFVTPPQKKLIYTILIVSFLLMVWVFSRQPDINKAVNIKLVNEKIARCRFWMVNDNVQPLVLPEISKILRDNNVECEHEDYNLYYIRSNFSIHAANEKFIGACPVTKNKLCKTIRYKSGAN
ncbi:winged helix-turn-helix domain-containing protein [Enterobacter sichuanensis]|uniref:winged helix-turn-helix domain-containing protein n=1 Tax=Enterobacter sichuanensis TaxID=2071710 RepID=UPI003F1D8E0A